MSAKRFFSVPIAALLAFGPCFAACHGSMHPGKRIAGGAGGSGSQSGGAVTGSSVAGGVAGASSNGGQGGAVGGWSTHESSDTSNPGGGQGGEDTNTATGTGGISAVSSSASGGNATGGTRVTAPLGTRPSQWTPPFLAPTVGTPGWRQSTTPFCDTNRIFGEDGGLGMFGGNRGFDVWADERGVFALTTTQCGDPMADRQGCLVYDVSLQFNSGAGWTTFHQFAPDLSVSPRLLSGLPNGPLILSGGFGDRASLGFLDKNGLIAQPETWRGSMAVSVPGRDAGGGDIVYAVGASVLKYSGGGWKDLGGIDAKTEHLYAAWTDGKNAVAVGEDQLVMMGPVDGTLTRLSGVPAGNYYAVWGFGADDLWFGNSEGQLVHFDGSQWELHDTGCTFYEGIQQLWGDAGIIYFATGTEFGRWNGNKAEVLLRSLSGTEDHAPTGSVGRFWGRSAQEVFIPVRDSTYKYYTCGTAFLLWFDGSQFHWF